VSRRRRYTQNTRSSERMPRFLSFLLACAGLFIFAVGINYMFPYFSKAVGDKVSEVVDYRAVFAALGEGISGEKKLGAAITEAWAEVTGSGGGDVPVITDGAEISPEINENRELTDAMLEAFSESHLDYADYMTPGGVDHSLI